MPQPGLIFRALIASPGDCIQERKIIPEVIRAWNATHSIDRAAIVEPVLWETHARPELGGRPQQIINNQLVSNCDLLIGAFWTKLGTPTGKAPSGTAEEIEEFRANGKPVLLYFSSVPVVPGSIDPEQYSALTDYRDELGKSGLYSGYNTMQEFREQLQQHFSSQMIELLKKHDVVSASSMPLSAGSDPASAEDEQEAALRQFVSEYKAFVRRFESEWIAERDSDPVNTEEAKYILASAQDDVVHFQSMITNDSSGLSEEMSKQLIILKQLKRHQTYIDGGVSYNQFWETGNECLNKLKDIATEYMAIEGA